MTTQSPSISASLLVRSGALKVGELRFGEIRFETLTISFVADLRDSTAAWLELRHTPCDAPAEDPYRIDLRPHPSPRGGPGWHFVGPGGLSRVIYCPSGSNRFASAKEHGGMRVPSDSFATKKRPLRKLQRLQELLAQSLPEPRRGGRGASHVKVAKLRAAVAAADGDLWRQAARAAKRPPD
jgi:hypothetical protein